MTRAWGHALRLLTAAEAAELVEAGRLCAAAKGRGGGTCRDDPTHESCYTYTVGAGVGRAKRPLCALHAARFAAKHTLAVPEPQR